MDISSCLLISPKCRNNGIRDFKKWKSKKQYMGDKIIRIYILYKSCTKWICCSCIRKGDSSIESLCSGNCCEVICISILMIFSAIFYILSCFWIDLINYCCTGKKQKYKVVRGYIKKDKKISTENSIYTENIWNEVDGLSEDQWNNENIGVCSNCNYTPSTFLKYIQNEEYIKIPNEIDTTDNNINYQTNNQGLNLVNINNIISINFLSVDGKVNYNIPCNKNEKFSEALKKLYI